MEDTYTFQVRINNSSSNNNKNKNNNNDDDDNNNNNSKYLFVTRTINAKPIITTINYDYIIL